MKTIIVTGGAGFIGSNFVYYLLKAAPGHRIVVFDKLTYAGNLPSLQAARANPRFQFIRGDIADYGQVSRLFQKLRPEFLFNLAAESHVDRSIKNAEDFVRTNLNGTFQLLDAARDYVRRLSKKDAKQFRFLHVSTDEVYGSLGKRGAFSEATPYAPNSPYAATKAGADHLVRAYHETYGLPVIVTNCSNNYGPYQFPEKLIPLMILNALEGKALPVYGTGRNVRDWLYVEDHCSALWLAARKGTTGEKYNVGGNNERNNLQVVDTLCRQLEKVRPAASNPSMKRIGLRDYRQLVTFVQDRPGHDKRYAINSTKIRRELGWKPQFGFQDGLARTIRWYLSHLDWCDRVQKGKYQRGRLGLLNGTK